MTKKPSRLRYIKLKLVDAITNKTISWGRIRGSQLPESFPSEGQWQLADGHYIVEGAHPLHSQDFIPKGKLTLWLKKVEQ
jgi:hypothetical protein